MKSKERIDVILLLIVSVLMLIGTIMVYSASSAIAQTSDKYSSHAFFLYRQLIWFVLTFTVMLVVMRINLDTLRPLVIPTLFIALGLLAVVFFMPAIRDTHRWIKFGPISLQPSELFKYALVFYLAHSLSQKRHALESLRSYAWPYGPIIGVGALLIVMEPDLGSTLVLGATVLALLFIAGARLLHLAAALGGASAALFTLVFILGYKRGRVDSFFASLGDPSLASHQIRQSHLSLASGGIFGVGLGNGVFKNFFLPEPHTDFIFSSIGEELGFVGLIAILLLLFGLIWRGIRISIRQTDQFRFLLGIGITICLAVNMMINIAVVLGLIPTTGLALPFLSYGGSSLVVSGVAVGVLLNLSRTAVGYAR